MFNKVDSEGGGDYDNSTIKYMYNLSNSHRHLITLGDVVRASECPNTETSKSITRILRTSAALRRDIEVEMRDVVDEQTAIGGKIAFNTETVRAFLRKLEQQENHNRNMGMRLATI